MKFLTFLLPTSALCVLAVIVSCSSGDNSSNSYPSNQSVAHQSPGISTGRPAMQPSQLFRQANVRKDLIPYGKHARKYRRRMNPRYITIHSTQNYSSAADAMQHSLALKNGKLRAYKRKGGNRIGYLVWHYSIDQGRVVQHLPDNEQGEHADFDGPGNNYSLGLEMCENRGNNRAATIERTAKLAAYLMYKHDIPINNIKAHYHWPRYGLSKPHKNCPHFLLDNGKPGRKWEAFKDKINGYYKMITKPVMAAPAPTPMPQPQIPSQNYGPYYDPNQAPSGQVPYQQPTPYWAPGN